ncbi:MAG: phosphatase PAP2 family protein [Myxococcota bacterium]
MMLTRARLLTFVVGPTFGAYLLLVVATGHFMVAHAVIVGAALVLIYVPRLRPWMTLLLPFFLFGVTYDAMRFVVPLARELIPVQVAGPYRLELALFGVPGTGATPMLASAFLAQHTHVAIDLVTAFAYLFYFAQTFLVAFWLLWRNRPLLARFGWTYLALNFAGFVTYFLYPAAPPWYVEQYGLGPVVLDAPASAARLADVDAHLGISLFRSFYAQSANVFAAIPSLHAADPLLAWLYVRLHLHDGPHARWHWTFGAFWLLVCFGAIYLGHHYVIDVVLGSAYALVAYLAAQALARRRAQSS